MLGRGSAVSLLALVVVVGGVAAQAKEFQKEADPPLNCSAAERARSEDC
jgi:hypothetical protein